MNRKLCSLSIVIAGLLLSNKSLSDEVHVYSQSGTLLDPNIQIVIGANDKPIECDDEIGRSGVISFVKMRTGSEEVVQCSLFSERQVQEKISVGHSFNQEYLTNDLKDSIISILADSH